MPSARFDSTGRARKVGARLLVTNNYSPLGASPSRSTLASVNSDSALNSLLTPRRRGEHEIRNASHAVDLTQPPFSVVPIRSVGRVSGVYEHLYEHVRIFSLPLDVGAVE